MRKVICLSTAELVDCRIPSYRPELTLEDMIRDYACYRAEPYGLHFYTLQKRKKAMQYLDRREIISPHLLEIIEVPDV
jgi:hypothetical protein